MDGEVDRIMSARKKTARKPAARKSAGKRAGKSTKKAARKSTKRAAKKTARKKAAKKKAAKKKAATKKRAAKTRASRSPRGSSGSVPPGPGELVRTRPKGFAKRLLKPSASTEGESASEGLSYTNPARWAILKRLLG